MSDTQGNKPTEYKCPVCGKVFTSELGLKVHQAMESKGLMGKGSRKKRLEGSNQDTAGTVEQGQNTPVTNLPKNGELEQLRQSILKDVSELIEEKLGLQKGNGVSISETVSNITKDFYVPANIKLSPEALQYYRYTLSKAESRGEELDLSTWINEVIEEYYEDVLGVEGAIIHRPKRENRVRMD